MRRRKGFTLVELMVVIAIIVLLLALLVVLITGMVEKARNTKTHGIIKMLDEACHRYKVEWKVFPPMAPYSDSRCLHYFLGQDQKVPTGHSYDPSTGASTVTGYKNLPPMVYFKADMLDLPGGQESLDPVLQPPVPVIDAWGRVIQYRPYPGQQNTQAVDIWSLGEDDADPEDDITNWEKNY